MIDERSKKIDSITRNFTIYQNLSIFDKILAGEADDYCVRGKIDMKSNNGCMRDPVFLRTSQVPHCRTGKKYKAYPTYDFACPIADSIEGVTHVLRTSEFSDRNVLYYWILDALGLPKP
jgi:glutamyl/glutaminyl-tRNA synthetase